MLPLLPFVAGIATGALAIKLWRSDKSRAGLDKAQEKIRSATVSGLTAIEHSSAAMRERLSPAKTENGNLENADAAPAPKSRATSSPGKRSSRKTATVARTEDKAETKA